MTKAGTASKITIYHNPKCGTSRTTLAMIRDAGIEPHIVEYLKTPPDRARLKDLLIRAMLSPRDIVRTKEKTYFELGLDRPGVSDADIFEAMLAHPILMNRPIVATKRGVRLCRPAERVLDLIGTTAASSGKS